MASRMGYGTTATQRVIVGWLVTNQHIYCKCWVIDGKYMGHIS